MVLPAVDDLNDLGGVFADASEVEDPTTDLSAAFFNVNNADTASMTQTLPRAIASWVGGASPSDPLSGFVHAAVWGSSPGVKPVVTYTATGIYDITWPSSITDPLGNTQSVNLRRARAECEGSTPLIITTSITAANVVRVRVFDAAGVASALASTFTVWAY